MCRCKEEATHPLTPTIPTSKASLTLKIRPISREKKLSGRGGSASGCFAYIYLRELRIQTHYPARPYSVSLDRATASSSVSNL